MNFLSLRVYISVNVKLVMNHTQPKVIIEIRKVMIGLLWVVSLMDFIISSLSSSFVKDSQINLSSCGVIIFLFTSCVASPEVQLFPVRCHEGLNACSDASVFEIKNHSSVSLRIKDVQPGRTCNSFTP